MNKLYALISVAVLVSACSKEASSPAPAPAPAPAATAPAPEPAAAAPAPAPEPAAAAPAPAPEPAAMSPAASAPTASADLPQECQDYLNKVSACVSKQSGAAADAMKASLEQTRTTWASFGADKSQFVAACKAANDAFTAQAAAMNC